MEIIDGTSLAKAFRNIPDPRSARGIRHKLTDIITISVLAFICSADDFVSIHEYGKANEEWLASFLDLPHGIPSIDTFERIFATIKPEAWQREFSQWIKETNLYSDDGKDEIIALDGKTARGTKQENINALHTVSAWSSHGGIVLAQEQVESHSNEIPAIPEVITTVAPAGAVVTMDAMGTQRNIASLLRDYHADYVLALKDNHSTLAEQVRFAFEEHEASVAKDPELNTEITGYNFDVYQEEGKAHGRHEVRKYTVIDDFSYVPNAEQWKDIRSVTKVDCKRTVKGKVSYSTRYYISSLDTDAERIAHAIRSHWGIENSLHWVLDVVFNEDNSRTRAHNSQANLITLRHIALNLVKQDKSKKSIKAKRKRAGWDRSFLLDILAQL